LSWEELAGEIKAGYSFFQVKNPYTINPNPLKNSIGDKYTVTTGWIGNGRSIALYPPAK